MTDRSPFNLVATLATARGSRVLSLVLCVAMLSACAVGPDYQRPQAAAPVQYKEAQGWRQANPSDAMARGAWWELYGDAQLNGLVNQLNASNQTVAQADAQYRQARALVRNARGAFFPTVDLTVGKTRSSQGTGGSSSSLSSSSSGIRDTYNAQAGVSWEADVWGKLRRTLEADEASAQAGFADLAAMRLSQQSELVQNYLQLRVIDEQKRLLQTTVDNYQRSLKMTENQYRAGVSGKDAVAQAQTQLKTTQGDLIDLIWQRAQFENAIAVLIGLPPAEFNLAETQDIPSLPQIPVALPFAVTRAPAGYRLGRTLGDGRQRQHRGRQGRVLPGPDPEPQWRLQQQHLRQLGERAEPLLVGRATTGDDAVRWRPAFGRGRPYRRGV